MQGQLLQGLVLAGGHSRRMGSPKCMIDYHGMPQYEYACRLLEPFCSKVFISCRAEQQELFQGRPLIFDAAEWGDIGPLNGLLSAFQTNPCAWLVLGCDYPWVTSHELAALLENAHISELATVFRSPTTGFVEPLIGLYQAAAAGALLEWWKAGNGSLRVFLEQQEGRFLSPLYPERLISVDRP